MTTDNNKRLEIENLQDAMRIAKQLLKHGYQVYMNIEDDIGDGKIIVVIEYEWLDEELADGHYIYQTFEDEARIEAEIRQKKADTEETTENCEDNDDDDDYHGDYSSWSEEHRKWFDAGYNEGYTTAKYDFCDCPDED